MEQVGFCYVKDISRLDIGTSGVKIAKPTIVFDDDSEDEDNKL